MTFTIRTSLIHMLLQPRIRALIFAGLNNINACSGEAVDPVWNIQWDFTIVGSQDVQTCPRIDGIQTFGKLWRHLSVESIDEVHNNIIVEVLFSST